MKETEYFQSLFLYVKTPFFSEISSSFAEVTPEFVSVFPVEIAQELISVHVEVTPVLATIPSSFLPKLQLVKDKTKSVTIKYFFIFSFLKIKILFF